MTIFSFTSFFFLWFFVVFVNIGNIGDFHTHSFRCRHASGTLEDYVKGAISKGLTSIGLCDHFPMHILPEELKMVEYAMKLEEVPEYISMANKVKEKYAGDIEVLIGIEVDYYPPCFQLYKTAITPFLSDFDYMMGSVHILEWEGESVWGVIDTTGPAKVKEHGLEKVMIEYFNTLIKLVETGFFQVLGHMDLPKKYFPYRFEKNEIVWNKLLSLLDSIQNSNIIVEINTSGYYKGAKEQYTSDLIIQELIKRDIPITLGSDAHSPEDVAHKFDEVIQKLNSWGLKELDFPRKK